MVFGQLASALLLSFGPQLVERTQPAISIPKQTFGN